MILNFKLYYVVLFFFLSLPQLKASNHKHWIPFSTWEEMLGYDGQVPLEVNMLYFKTVSFGKKKTIFSWQGPLFLGMGLCMR